MKKLTLFIALFFASLTITDAQIVLSYQAGSRYNKTTIGYNTDMFMPYFGLQLLHFGYSTEYELSNGKHSDEISISAIMPSLGVKAFLLSKESIKGGVDLGLYKPIFSGKLEDDGIEDEDFAKAVKETKAFLGELGFFAEYFLSDNFSIGGEFGFRYGVFKTDTENDFFDKNKLSFDATYTTFSANFYF